MFGGRTRVFALLGDPVAHSLSPRMQNAAFRAAGLDAAYVALRPEPAVIGDLMRTLTRDGGGGNVTLPFKTFAAAASAMRDPLVDVLGSANVFGASPEGVRVGNTDVDGIVAAVLSLGIAATSWGVIGTGGSARAVAGAALRSGVALAVQSRDDARGRTFAAWAASIGVARAEWDACRLVINATPLGLHGDDPLPCDPAGLRAGTGVLDLAYRADGPTRWVGACAARGMSAVDGRAVLLAQGAASWGYWFPGIAVPVEVMRAALFGRLV